MILGYFETPILHNFDTSILRLHLPPQPFKPSSLPSPLPLSLFGSCRISLPSQLAQPCFYPLLAGLPSITGLPSLACPCQFALHCLPSLPWQVEGNILPLNFTPRLASLPFLDIVLLCRLTLPSSLSLSPPLTG